MRSLVALAPWLAAAALSTGPNCFYKETDQRLIEIKE
jgi:hypothetical protein